MHYLVGSFYIMIEIQTRETSSSSETVKEANETRQQTNTYYTTHQHNMANMEWNGIEWLIIIYNVLFIRMNDETYVLCVILGTLTTDYQQIYHNLIFVHA